jgi:hypothetical protein
MEAHQALGFSGSVTPYRSRIAFASSVRPSASSASAVTRALSLVHCDCLVEQRLGFAGVAGSSEHTREVAEAGRRLGMLGAEHPFTDRKCVLQERPRCCKVALLH